MSKPSPRFRTDLNAVATETDGVLTVEVTDLQTGTSFTFYEFEYALAQQLNGQEIDDIVAWVVANYEETSMPPEAIEEFAAKLGEIGFLEPEDGDGATEINPAEPPPVPAMAKPPHVPEGGLTLDSLELGADAMNELSGKISSSSAGIPKAVTGGASGGFSRGFGERRQPPGPEAVEMAPFEDVSLRFRAPPPERKRSSTGTVVAVVLLIAGGGAAGYAYWLKQHPQLPQAIHLHVVAPQPTTVYRWFASAGTVVDLESRSLMFETTGKVVELLPTGTKFKAGDTLGRLAGAKALEDQLATHKAKLAAFEQLRDSLKAAGKPSQKADLKDAEDKVAARKKLVDDTQAALAKLILKAPEAGTILETPAKVGLLAAAKVAALKWRGQNLHGDFTMDQEDYAKASKLEFCRVEVSGLGTPPAAPGAAPSAPVPAHEPAPAAKGDAGAGTAASGEPRFVDCTIPPPGPPPPGVPSLLRKFIVTLPMDAGLVTGQQLHLARKRYQGVFVLPPSAVEVQTDVVGRIWVAAPNGTAEPRPVTIVEARDEVLVSEGINVGDEIISEPPRELSPGTLVDPIR
jgi:multidrug efflux pump subunit AcrA (membrane-fusion protein)